MHENLRGLSHTITTERERLKHTLEQEDGSVLQGNASYVSSLRQSLTEMVKHNQDLRQRLSKISELAVLKEPIPVAPESVAKIELGCIFNATRNGQCESSVRWFVVLGMGACTKFLEPMCDLV